MIEIVKRTTLRNHPQAEAVLSQGETIDFMNLVRDVPIAAHVEHYAAKLLLATHPNNEYATPSVKRYVKYGGSPRGLQAMTLGGKVRALLDDRYHVAAEDIRKMTKIALRHRILLNFEGEAEEINTDSIVDEILQSIEVDVG